MSSGLNTLLPADAQKIAVKLNLTLNNGLLFGINHPSLATACDGLADMIREVCGSMPYITFIKNGESFYVEKNCVDSQINAKRTLGHFLKIELESITFSPSVESKDLLLFFKLYLEAIQNDGSADLIQKQLDEMGVTSVIPNYVTLKQVTREQKILDENAIDSYTDSSTSIDEKLSQFFINQTSEPIKKVDLAKELENEILNNGTFSGAADRVREASENGDIPLDSIFSSLVEVSQRIKEERSLQKTLHDTANIEDVSSDLEKLTLDTMVDLIVKEYKSGEQKSPKEVATLMKRITSSPEELQRLFPYVKRRLMESGIPLSFFMELSKELFEDIQVDTSLRKIFTTIDDFGVTKEELIEAINRSPEESVKLILQGAELAKMGSGADFSDQVATLIEDISHSQASKGGGESNQLSDLVRSVESQLLEKLRSQNSDKGLVKEVEKKLLERFPETLEKIRTDWVVSQISNAQEITPEAIATMISRATDGDSDIDQCAKELSKMSDSYGFSVDEIEAIVKEAKKRKEIEERRKNYYISPPATTVYFIKRYIEEYKRYKHPFSIICLSGDDAHFTSTPFKDWVAIEMGPFLRVLDIIGTVSANKREFTVIIFPMTDSEGLRVVASRFEKSVFQSSSSISKISCDSHTQYDSYEDMLKRLIRPHFEY